jgi:hypothetical protein
MKKIITKIVAGVAPVVAAIALAPAGHATPTSSEFCSIIDNNLSQGLSYQQIIIAAGLGAAQAGVPSNQAAEILVQSVNQYCPEHLQGLYYAAKALS